jgi:transposase-like protein
VPKTKVSPDIKAAALAALHAGEQPAVVADRYGINPNTVKSWSRRLADAPDIAPVAPDIAPVAPKPIARPSVEAQQRQIGSLILDLLAAKLEASEAIAKAACDPDWLKQQPASELAALGQWLDSTAFAIGDRLAGAANSQRGAHDTRPGTPPADAERDA